jgi:hypothetical protein
LLAAVAEGRKKEGARREPVAAFGFVSIRRGLRENNGLSLGGLRLHGLRSAIESGRSNFLF